MSKKTAFHFFSYRYAIRFHIARRLESLGWTRVERAENASFSDKNLTLNDTHSLHLEYKHLLANLVQQNHLTVMPLTYCVNEENASQVFSQIIYEHYLKNNYYQPSVNNLKWILKPSTLNNGDNIYLFNNIEELKKHYLSPKRLGGDHVVQQYLANPHLIDGRKYTYRIPVILTNYTGILVYKQGYINISAHPFDLEDKFANKKVHITNYVIDGELANIEQRSTQQIEQFDKVFSQMCVVIRNVMQALLRKCPDYLKKSAIQKFEIFGFDFIMDDQGKLWLLEINQGPDAPMYEENHLKKVLWEPFWNDIIQDFVLPIGLNIASKNNHINFERIMKDTDCYSWWKNLLRNINLKLNHQLN